MSLLNLITLLLSFQSVAAVPRIHQRSISCPAANGTTFGASNGQQFRIECGIDHYGGDMPAPNGQSAATLDACIAQCIARSGCNSVQWADKWACYLKSTVNAPSAKSNVWGAILVPKTSKPATSTTTSTITDVTTVTVPISPRA